MSLKLLYFFCLEVILIVFVGAIITNKQPDGVEAYFAPPKQPKELIVEYSWVRGFPLDQETSKIRQSFLYWMQQANRVFDWLRKLDNGEHGDRDVQPPTIFVQGHNLWHFCSTDGQNGSSLEEAKALEKPRQIVCWLKDFLDKNNHIKQVPALRLDSKSDANTAAAPKTEANYDGKRPLTVGKAQEILKYLKEFLKDTEKPENITPNVDPNHRNQDISRDLRPSGQPSQQPKPSHNDVPKTVHKRSPASHQPAAVSYDPQIFIPKYIEPANKLLFWLEDLIKANKNPEPLIPNAYKRAPEGMKDDSLYRNDHRTNHYNDEEDEARHAIDQLNNFSRQDESPSAIDDLNNFSRQERAAERAPSRVDTLSSPSRQDRTPSLIDDLNNFSRQERVPSRVDTLSSPSRQDRTPSSIDDLNNFSRQERVPSRDDTLSSPSMQGRTPHLMDESNSFSRQDRTPRALDESNSFSRPDRTPRPFDESNSFLRQDRAPRAIDESNSFLGQDSTPHVINGPNSLSRQERVSPIAERSNSLPRQDRTPLVIDDPNSMLRPKRTPHLSDDSNSFPQNSYEQTLMDSQSDYESSDPYEEEMSIQNSMSANGQRDLNYLSELKNPRTYNEFVDDRFFAHLDHANKILYWLKNLIAQSKNVEVLDKVGVKSYPPTILEKIKKAIRELETLKEHLLSSY
uniref:Uncharacterized protein n=1 Tax=Glossina austeni TaxID=7395 RepID=A0A1A9UY28_GLOAU